MKSYRSSFGGETVYHRRFTSLRGVDFSPSPDISKSHFADMENMWRDPVAENGALESYPGYRVFASFPSPIFGVYHQRANKKSYLVVHAGERLYRFESRLRNHPRALSSLLPLPIMVGKEKGCAFSDGESLYLLICGSYYRISSEGSVFTLGEEECHPYVPLTYYNGEMYEQRNLLTNEVRHVFSADGDYLHTDDGTNTLSYRIYNKALKLCSVAASSLSADCAVLSVPESVLIDGESYTVKGIDSGGFANMRTLTSICLPEGIEHIGESAFAGCTALFSVNLPKTALRIGKSAFYGCLSLSEIYFSDSMTEIGENAFSSCPSLSSVLFGGTKESYDGILMKGSDTLRDKNLSVTFEAHAKTYRAAILRYPLLDPTERVLSVSLGDFSVTDDNTPYENGLLRYRTVKENDLITHLELITSDEGFLAGKKLTLHLLASPSRFSSPRAFTAFGTGHPEISGKDAICRCRLAIAHDGRVFFTGNPALPNTVFHSLPDDTGLNNPLYIGNLSYFNDGSSATENRALLSTGEFLVVFKGDEDADGAIFYHKAESTGIDYIPRIYPVSAALSGVGAWGEAICFKDDPVFLSRRGLLGMEKQSVNLERSLAVRSFPVSTRLCREDLSSASLAVHEGMLYLLSGGNVYIADSRRFRYREGGEGGYEWYFLSHVGAFEGDRPLYKRTARLPDGADAEGILSGKEGAPALGTVYSMTLPSGESVFYEKTADGKKYAVDTDGERTGGVFRPATVLCAAGGALFFGTESGHLGCMNTDKRGQGLYRLLPDGRYAKRYGVYIPLNENGLGLQSEDTIELLPLFEKKNGDFIPAGEGWVYIDGHSGALVERIDEGIKAHEIHSHFYSYAGHAYTAACTLAADDGDAPHYAKDTMPLSVAAKVKTAPGGSFHVLVRTERSSWEACERLSAGRADFSAFDFSRLDFYGEDSAILSLRERERGWCFKQFRFVETEARHPFGLYALFYAFTVSGHIKS